MKKLFLAGLLFLLGTSLQAQVRFEKTVDTVNDLQNLQPDDIHNVVFVKGYASALAGDGAEFIYDSTSAAATNTVSVFKPTSVSGNGRWLRRDPTFQAGSTTVPSITFGLDSNTGFANTASDQIDIINGGLRKWYITSGGIFTAVGAQTIGTTTGDLTLNTGAANGNILFNPNGTGGVGIGTTPSGGANSLKIGGTTASTTTATGSLINAGGFGNAGAANIGGVLATTDTTEATTGGAGALKSSGGIYAAKKIVGATDLIVNTSLIYADSAASKLGVGTTGPDKKLDVLDTTGLQYRATYTDGTVYTDWGTLSSGATFSTNSLGHRTTSTIVNDTAVLSHQTRGGLAFDGVTTGTKSSHYLNTTFAAGSALTLSFTVRIPETVPSTADSLFKLSTTDTTWTTANSVISYIHTDGKLNTEFRDGSSGAKNINSSVSLISAYGGKTITITIVRDGSSTPKLYFNCVEDTAATTSGAGTGFNESIAATYFNIAQLTSTTLSRFAIFSATLFNRALTASEVVTLANQGVQESDKSGNLTGQTSGTLTRGKRYRITTFVAGDSFTNVGAGSNATGVEFVATGTTPTTWTNASTLNQIGAILDADLSAGVGYQVPDRSSNKSHGTVSTTGTTWTLANRRGQVRATTNTSGNQQILGQSCLPTTAIIKSIVGYTTGTPTIYIGNVSAGNQHVTATAMSASTYTDFTVATKSTTGNVWVNSTTADTINWVIDYILGDY